MPINRTEPNVMPLANRPHPTVFHSMIRAGHEGHPDFDFENCPASSQAHNLINAAEMVADAVRERPISVTVFIDASTAAALIRANVVGSIDNLTPHELLLQIMRLQDAEANRRTKASFELGRRLGRIIFIGLAAIIGAAFLAAFIYWRS